VLAGDGFSESAIVDLDLHKPELSVFEDFGYDSDSDLDSVEDLEEEPTAAAEPSQSADGEIKAQASDSSPSGRCARAGRVVVLKDTAFKTCVSRASLHPDTDPGAFAAGRRYSIIYTQDA
jgi:hypothetical protein